jgi:hypothetical protein
MAASSMAWRFICVIILLLINGGQGVVEYVSIGDLFEINGLRAEKV